MHSASPRECSLQHFQPSNNVLSYLGVCSWFDCPRTSTALPPSQCHCQRAPTTMPHRQWISTVPQPSRCASAHPLHRLTDSAYPLHHSPHTICDQVTYTAWQSNHEAHQDMHSATQEDADFRGKWFTSHSTMALSLPSKRSAERPSKKPYVPPLQTSLLKSKDLNGATLWYDKYILRNDQVRIPDLQKLLY